METCTTEAHFRWRLSDADVLSDQFRAQIAQFLEFGGHGHAEILKQARQRLVLRLQNEDAGHSVVLKIFPLSNPISRLRYKKYAFSEYRNLLAAQDRGVRVPAPYGYVEFRRFGLVSSCAVIMEDFLGWQNLRELGEREGPAIALRLATAPLLSCYEKGCHNLDIRDENILISPERSLYAVIDWQYANFTMPKAPGLIEFLVAHYLKKLSSNFRQFAASSWLPGLASRNDMPLNLQKNVMRLLDSRLSLRRRRGRKIR